jgi:polar amino acid transport system substrate-binding protein
MLEQGDFMTVFKIRAMIRLALCCLPLALWVPARAAAAGPDCSRPFTLALHEHGLLYCADTNSGIDKDFADELIRRSGCQVKLNVMPRARIWQLIESGALDFSLSGITNPERDRFAGFAWYFSNKYYLLVRKDVKVSRLAEVKRKDRFQLGVIRGFRYSPSANRLVDELQAANRVSQSNGLSPLYQSLFLNRIQGMIIEPFDSSALDEMKLRALTNLIEFNDPPVPHGLIMSKKSLSASEQKKWRDLVNAMRFDGTVRRIFEKHFSSDIAATMTNFQAYP